jgi:hypothetical protein
MRQGFGDGYPSGQNKSPVRGRTGLLGSFGGNHWMGGHPRMREHPHPSCWEPSQEFNSVPLTFFGPTQTLPTSGLLMSFPLRVGNRGKRGKPGLSGKASSALRATPNSSLSARQPSFVCSHAGSVVSKSFDWGATKPNHWPGSHRGYDLLCDHSLRFRLCLRATRSHGSHS